jgi:hypothetical protein
MSNIEARLLTLLVKVESPYGSDSTPAVGTNAVMPRSFKDDPNIAEVEKPRVDAKHRTVGKQIASVSIPIEAEFELVGHATAGTAPQFGPILKAAGMSETVSIGTSVTYAYNSLAAQSSVSMYAYKYQLGGAAAALLHKYLGVRFGALEISGGVDAPFVIKVSGEGLFGGTSDATPTVASLAFSDEILDGANGKNCTFTIGGVSTDIKSFSLKTNREAMRRDSIVGTYGVKEIFVTAAPGSVHEITLDREVQLKADLDHWSRMLADTTKFAWSISWTSPGGSIVTIAGPKLQEGSFSYNDDGILRLDQTFYACDDADTGDDALTIAFT